MQFIDLLIALYARLSEDRSGLSENVHIQLREGEEFVEDNGVTVSLRFSDDDKGASKFSKKPRPDYDRLVAAIERGEVEIIVVTEMTRPCAQVGPDTPQSSAAGVRDQAESSTPSQEIQSPESGRRSPAGSARPARPPGRPAGRGAHPVLKPERRGLPQPSAQLTTPLPVGRHTQRCTRPASLPETPSSQSGSILHHNAHCVPCACSTSLLSPREQSRDHFAMDIVRHALGQYPAERMG
jgi:hypothetical protein